MAVPAAKGTAEILSPAVARVAQKEDPAVRAALEARPKVRLRLQRQAQGAVVPKDEVKRLALAVPAQAEREDLLDFYDKKARVSLTMLRL